MPTARPNSFGGADFGGCYFGGQQSTSSGTVHTQSLTASLTPTGAIHKHVILLAFPSGHLSFTSSIVKQIIIPIHAALTTTEIETMILKNPHVVFIL